MKRARKQIVGAGYAYSAEGSVNAPSYTKTFILAMLLALPCTWIAISISDNVTVPDSVRYVISPGTMLGMHLVMQPTHDSSLQPTFSLRGTIDQLLDQLGRWFAIAFFTDMAFYSMLIFGFVTVARALTKPN
jgi:hypothetical protein